MLANLRRSDSINGEGTELIGSVSGGCVDPLEQISITREEVLGVLGSIKVDKSPGPDGICPRLFRERQEMKLLGL